MGSRHEYAINGMIFAIFDWCSGVFDCDWRKNFSKNGDGFPFS